MSTPACADCESNGVLVERRGKMVCEWCANRYWPMTPDERRETGETISLAVLRAAGAEFEHLASTPFGTASQGGERIRKMLGAALDIDEMAAAYGDAQFGPGGWDDAPAVIRNDIRNHMQRVRRAILGDTTPTPKTD